jgi:LysM repeat protein
MKKIILIASSLFITAIGFAQQLLVHNSGKDFYIEHKVVPKENFYSVGRLYELPPKEIAAYNNLDMTHGLTIGQTIKIPLTAANFSQTAEAGKPVYYVVGQKEGLYRVSLKNNNVLMANLRKWNHLQNDQIKTGSKLIVGYINGAVQNPNIAVGMKDAPPKTTPIETAKEEIKKEEPKQEEPKKEVKHTEQKAAEPVVEKPAGKKAESPKAQPIETKTVESKPAYATTYLGGAGYFEKEYQAQTKAHGTSKDQTATSGIFKTASGWQDGKYYAMIDGAEPGTIIKLVNPTNNKTVYAKVLSQMSGIRQNQGLDVRISNAAASALEVQDTEKFVVKVSF